MDALKKYKRALTIAGSDSGGGAGIQADLKTFAALQCYGTSVITAVTAQNTIAVTAVHPVPATVVEQQLEAVLSDIGTDAVKIGMLFSAEVIERVACTLARFKVPAIVLDPVMVATSGRKLLEDEAVKTLREKLIPMVQLFTPNLPEAEVLTGMKIRSEADMERAGRKLLEKGCQAVLVKGGHLQGRVAPDYLLIQCQKDALRFGSDRVDTPNTHGTGCTLSSAITAYLARDYDLTTAVCLAKEYLFQALQHGSQYQVGYGHGPLHHLYGYWQ